MTRDAIQQRADEMPKEWPRACSPPIVSVRSSGPIDPPVPAKNVIAPSQPGGNATSAYIGFFPRS
jgi:hypothetical protein